MKKLLLSLTTLFLMSCGGGSETETSSDLLSGEVKIDGSSTVYPITEAIAEEFRAVQPKVKVTVGVSGTGGGFKKLVEVKHQFLTLLDQLKTQKLPLVMKTIYPTLDYLLLMMG